MQSAKAYPNWKDAAKPSAYCSLSNTAIDSARMHMHA